MRVEREAYAAFVFNLEGASGKAASPRGNEVKISLKLLWWVLLVTVLFPVCQFADTYDKHTLVAITTAGPDDVQLLYDCHVDIVGRRGDVYKALLTDDQSQILSQRNLKIEILYAEMAEDRRLWKEADEASEALAATAYYSASKFNTTTPPAGSLMEHLLQLYNAHPTICRLYNLGATQDGNYDIIAMKVTKNPDSVETEPKIRIYGNIHGDEKIGCMVACDVLDTILAGYTAVPQDATAKKLVDETEMWFIPMGNPYGNANNTRYNSRSVDCNRNFWGPGGNDDCYPQPCTNTPWTEKETQAIRDLTEAATADHSKKRFTVSISFHSGDECFNSVWNYSAARPTDEPIFWASRTPGSGCSDQNGCLTLAPHGLAQAYKDGCTQPGFWFTNGYDWYQTLGDTNDWSYGEWTGLDTTVELDTTKTPAVGNIATDCGYHRQAILNYMMKTFQGIHGVMTDSGSGAALDGTVTATCTASSTIAVPHAYSAIYTDPVAGDFHRVLQPGTYTVACSCAGYMTTTVTGVVVAAGTKSIVNCAMSKTGLKYSSSAFTDSCSGGGLYGGDGVLDAGEDATLQVTLSNPGSVAATSVQATLSTSTSGITITQNTASFADVPGGGTGLSVSPHFRFSVGTGVTCGTVITFNIHMTSAQGAWDDSFSVTVGQQAAGTPTTAFSESFDGISFPPTGWNQLDVSGTAGNWARSTNTVHPSGGGTHSGAGLAYFNSYTAASSSRTRLYRTSGFSIPASSVSACVTFWMYHDTGDTAGDQVQVQVSTNGTTWTNVGTAISRYDGSSGWSQHAVSLNAYIGAVSAQVGFLGISAYGNDCHIDDVLVTYTPPGTCTMHACTPSAVPPETAPGGSSATAEGWTGKTTTTWPTNAQATSYKVYRGIPANLPYLLNASTDSCLKWTGSATNCTVSDDPSSVTGRFYWYLVIGTNAAGDGSAGSATGPVARVVNSSGNCP